MAVRAKMPGIPEGCRRQGVAGSADDINSATYHCRHSVIAAALALRGLEAGMESMLAWVTE